MQLNFDKKEEQVMNKRNADVGCKETKKVRVFTDNEVAELKKAFDIGGVLITIWEDIYRRALVTEPVYNHEIVELSESLSLKLFELYSDPIPCGFHQVSLRQVIEQYC